MKQLRLISLFSGYGTQELALKYAGINYINIANCDILKNANKAYDSLHKTVLGNLGDVKKIDEKNFPECDFLTYSFPCFTESTLILTNTGYKKIKNVNIGDKVITHNNRYKEVLNKFDQGRKEIWNVVSSSVDMIETTKNHKFYIKTKYKNTISEPYWKECYQLTNDDYLGIAINQNSIIPKWNGIQFLRRDGQKSIFSNELNKLMNINDFWWIVGRYIGDGWIRSQGGIIICCSLTNELLDITSKLDNLNIKYNITKERTTYKIHIPRKEFSEFFIQFGKGAQNKRLTDTIIDLPVNLLKSFIEGYHSADGNIYKNSNRYRISSVSRELIYGVAQCIAKVYKIPYSIYKSKKPNKYIIEGRVVNQRNTYILVYDFTENKKISFYESGYIWSHIKNVTNTKILDNVWDIEVEEDHSFTANGCIVHNCQDISLAGVQRGIKKGTRSGLLYEVERIVTYNKPKFLLMENVKNLVSKNHITQFKEYINTLSSIGYGSSWIVLNGSDYECAQNRERVFMFSILNESHESVNQKLYSVVKKQQPTVSMRKFLESEVDSNLFINPPIELVETKDKGVCKLLAKRLDRKFEQRRRIYSIDACSPCLNTTDITQIMLDDGRIRFISPREAYRFMGVKDDDIDKLLSTNILWNKHVALAGNSICVPVMQAIFEIFFEEYKQ